MTESTFSTPVITGLSTTKLLDLLIDRQSELKKLDAFVKEIRKIIEISIGLGELESLAVDGTYVYNNLRIQPVSRKVWEYSPAVDALKEQEQFNGTALQKTNVSHRFIIKDPD